MTVAISESRWATKNKIEQSRKFWLLLKARESLKNLIVLIGIVSKI